MSVIGDVTSIDSKVSSKFFSLIELPPVLQRTKAALSGVSLHSVS